MASSSSSSCYNSPCAACKFLRRKCLPGCVFAPYFPPEEPQKFSNVHKIFGASNVSKLLSELHPHQREEAVSSLAYEAEARIRDPVYGCVRAITFLQRQVDSLQKELDAANAKLIRYAGHSNAMDHHHQFGAPNNYGSYSLPYSGGGSGGGGAFPRNEHHGYGNNPYGGGGNM